MAGVRRAATNSSHVDPQLPLGRATGPDHPARLVPGFHYRLVVALTAEARNVYAVSARPATTRRYLHRTRSPPRSVRTSEGRTPLSEHEPTSQYDSFVTIGTIDMEHPDIVDNVRMLASGMQCELACDDGYEVVGGSSCTAGSDVLHRLPLRHRRVVRAGGAANRGGRRREPDAVRSGGRCRYCRSATADSARRTVRGFSGDGPQPSEGSLPPGSHASGSLQVAAGMLVL